MGVGDHLVLVARHQPLQRVPDNHELQVIFINQLQLFPVLIKTVKSVEWSAVLQYCSASLCIFIMTISQCEDPFRMTEQPAALGRSGLLVVFYFVVPGRAQGSVQDNLT